ncbi:DUF1833 family protein [Luteimonas fraxinea]|uniref:DUF1833 domain-containing protein n=1 Tax=Luteimonas fraxinea TaxID=2901869 RepID=A0ABS8UAH6_9GAMM|nr:DUF1833 family protein [Luteimonas fraxinea]MCD9096204.1 DUF1833 domain-containing protein [Luteimonas fraxinea]
MTFTERKQRVTDTAGLLLFLEIGAPSFPETLRIVSDTQNWTSNGIEYIACPFGFKLPDDTPGQTPRAQLVIDNVGLGMTQDLESLQPNELVMCRLMVSDRANPNAYERVYRLPMTMASAGTGQVTAQLGVDFLMRQQAVRVRANPFTTPGIF